MRNTSPHTFNGVVVYHHFNKAHKFLDPLYEKRKKKERKKEECRQTAGYRLVTRIHYFCSLGLTAKIITQRHNVEGGSLAVECDGRRAATVYK